MDTKLVILTIFSYLYTFFELFISLRQRRRSGSSTPTNKGSIWTLILSFTIGCTLAFTFANSAVGKIGHWNLLFAFGFIIIITGFIIRITSIITLKKYFTYSVTFFKDHELIEKGLYKKIRHPGYLGLMMVFLGISVALANWISIAAMMIPVLVGFIHRISVEEKFLVAQMGQKYADYQKRTSRLIPKIF